VVTTPGTTTWNPVPLYTVGDEIPNPYQVGDFIPAPTKTGWNGDLVFDTIYTTAGVVEKEEHSSVKSKFPYDIKTDLDSIYYLFAVAGYSSDQIKIARSNDGLEIKLSAESEDDYIGDLYEEIYSGIETGDNSIFVTLDFSKYDVDNVDAKIKNGILQLKIKSFTPKEIEVTDGD
jgi:HSP20 family molecular chaperone IbpA